MKKRTDPHRPGAIVPQDYIDLFMIDGGSGSEPSIGINCMRPIFDWRTREMIPGRTQHSPDGLCCVLGSYAAGYKHASTGREHSSNKCTVCGSWFRFGSAWKHVPTGDIIFVGHDCADKYDFVATNMTREDWKAYRKAISRRNAEAAKDAKHAKARDRFIEDNELIEVFKAREADVPAEDTSRCPHRNEEHETDVCFSCQRKRFDPRRKSIAIMNDLYRSLHHNGFLSGKQVELARKLAETIRNPPPKIEEELKVAAPTGRVVFEGIIVGAKFYDNEYGGSVKITVKVTTPEGVWLAWGSLPSAVEGSTYEQKGKTIKLKATLSPGNEPHFAFFKRPSLIEVSKQQ